MGTMGSDLIDNWQPAVIIRNPSSEGAPAYVMLDSLDVAEVHPTVKRWIEEGKALRWSAVQWCKRAGVIVVKLEDGTELQIKQ